MADKVATKRKLVVILVITAVIVIAGLATGVVLVTSSKHSSANNKQTITENTTSSTTTTNQYKLSACKSGATQTIGNAAYLVGTDIAPGSYKVVSQTGDTGWSNINVYSSKVDYDKQGDPTNEQGNPAISLAPQNGTTTVTKLSDGQYMVLDADPATFTCN